MNSLVSVDYDFFIPHGMYEDVTFPDGSTHSGMLVYDWQMSETRPAEFEQYVWETRAYNFHRWGLDIVKLTEPKLSVEDFAQKVSMGIGDYSTPILWRADSHAWGAILARDTAEMCGEPINVINFDAHHDLGYTDQDPLARFKATGALSCDNWALVGLHEGWIANYTLVYPDWLGCKEWMPTEKRIKPWRKQIEVTTWSEWDGEIPNAEMMFFCRSSSWTPPWLDAGFKTLTEEFGYSECLDCAMNFNGPYDTCEMRSWDWEQIEAGFKERDSMIEQLDKIGRELLA